MARHSEPAGQYNNKNQLTLISPEGRLVFAVCLHTELSTIPVCEIFTAGHDISENTREHQLLRIKAGKYYRFVSEKA
jgi:hypothetical protein